MEQNLSEKQRYTYGTHEGRQKKIISRMNSILAYKHLQYTRGKTERKEWHMVKVKPLF